MSQIPSTLAKINLDSPNPNAPESKQDPQSYWSMIKALLASLKGAMPPKPTAAPVQAMGIGPADPAPATAQAQSLAPGQLTADQHLDSVVAKDKQAQQQATGLTPEQQQKQQDANLKQQDANLKQQEGQFGLYHNPSEQLGAFYAPAREQAVNPYAMQAARQRQQTDLKAAGLENDAMNRKANQAMRDAVAASQARDAQNRQARGVAGTPESASIQVSEGDPTYTRYYGPGTGGVVADAGSLPRVQADFDKAVGTTIGTENANKSALARAALAHMSAGPWDDYNNRPDDIGLASTMKKLGVGYQDH